MASHDENPETQAMLICKEGDAAAPESQPLGTTTNSEPEVEIMNVSGDKTVAAKDPEIFRRNVLLTCWMILAFVSIGLVGVVIGPSLLDLITLVNSNLAEGSVLITIGSGGFVSGAICTGFLSKPFSYPILAFVSLLSGGILNAIMPWCPNLILMCLVNYFQCLCNGLTCTAVSAFCLETWSKDSATPMHAVHLGYAVGAFASPLIVKPFLSRTQTTPIHSTATVNQTTNSNNITAPIISSMNSSIFQTTEIMPNISLTNSSLPELPIIPKTQVQYAYLIIAIVMIFTSVPFGFNAFKLGIYRKTAIIKEQAKGASLKLTDTILPLFIVLVFYMILTGLEDGFSVFLTAFTVKYLNWTKQDGSMATFVYWLCFAIGRFVGIFMPKILTPNQMLLKDVFLMNIGTFVLLWSKSEPILVWIFFGLCGFAIAGAFPTGYAWIETYLFKVTGPICSSIAVFTSVGIAVNPLFIGHMMEKYNPRWYLFILFGESLVITGVFLALVFFARSQYWQNKKKLAEDTNNQSSIE